MLVSFLTALGITALLWVLYQGIKNNPEAFSRTNMSQTLRALGILGLLLISVVVIAVMMLR